MPGQKLGNARLSLGAASDWTDYSRPTIPDVTKTPLIQRSPQKINLQTSFIDTRPSSLLLTDMNIVSIMRAEKFLRQLQLRSPGETIVFSFKGHAN
jgi:hypothetical protein